MVVIIRKGVKTLSFLLTLNPNVMINKHLTDFKRALRFFLSKNELKKQRTRNRNKKQLFFGKMKRACDRYNTMQLIKTKYNC